MSESTSTGPVVVKAELSFCGSGSGAPSRVRGWGGVILQSLVASPTSGCYSRLKPQYPEGVIGQTVILILQKLTVKDTPPELQGK